MSGDRVVVAFFATTTLAVTQDTSEKIKSH